jgi:hypothetical protein
MSDRPTETLDDAFLRLILAFCAAPGAAALSIVLPTVLLPSVHFTFRDAMLAVLGIFTLALPVSLLVGLPLWALLHRRIAHSILRCAVLGVLATWLAMIVIGLVLYPLILLMLSNLLSLFLFFGFGGAAGGIAVWLVVGTSRPVLQE